MEMIKRFWLWLVSLFSRVNGRREEMLEQQEEWRHAFIMAIQELVPDHGPFELDATLQPDGSSTFNLQTEDRRVVVAWAELQRAIEQENGLMRDVRSL